MVTGLARIGLARIGLGLVACNGDVPVVEEGPEELSALALLSRLSLDLRGKRPTEAEMEQVEADPSATAEQVEGYLRDPGFGERLVALYADVYRTRTDLYLIGADGDSAFLDIPTRLGFLRSVGEEPLRILQRIAEDDLPYTSLVTADWTMANDDLLAAWPLEASEEGEGWRKARYTDTRPAAGVLTATGMWWRYTTTIENVNRGRAEAILRYIVCDDRFDQPVAFKTSTDAFDRVELQERTQTDPACIGCHVVLDPIGSFLFGFYRNHPESFSEAAFYYPGRESKWEEMTGVAPAYYGQPGESLYDLGQMIAADPSFVNCAVKQGFSFLMGREAGVADVAEMNTHREAFIGGDLTLRSLYRSLVTDARYRSVDEAGGGVPLKRLGPDQLASAVEALTGFRWTYFGLDMMNTDAFGLRILSGGADGLIVSTPASDHATTTVLSQQRLAELAAAYAVENEGVTDPGSRILFQEVADLSAVPTADALVEQIQALILRIHGRRAEADDPDVEGLSALWVATEDAAGDPAGAWTVVLSALLRHPDFIHY